MAVSPAEIGRRLQMHHLHQFIILCWVVSCRCGKGQVALLSRRYIAPLTLCCQKLRQGHGLDVVCRATYDMHVATQDLFSVPFTATLGCRKSLVLLNAVPTGSRDGKSSL